jgi:hypothetical protein
MKLYIYLFIFLINASPLFLSPQTIFHTNLNIHEQAQEGFAAQTLVKTPAGLSLIEDLQEEQKAITYDIKSQ